MSILVSRLWPVVHVLNGPKTAGGLESFEVFSGHPSGVRTIMKGENVLG